MTDEKTFPASDSKLDKTLATQVKQKPRSFVWGNDFHYRALFEQSDDCIFIISFDLCYLAANPQALRLLGYSVGEMKGKPVSDIMDLDESLGQGIGLEGSSNLSERILRRKDGTTVPVEISTSIVYDKTGNPAYIQSIARDIYRRKEVERALHRHAEIMLSISNSTTRLLQSTKIEKKIAELLASLGQATGAVSCFIIHIQTIPGSYSIKTRFEWQKDSTGQFNLAKILTPQADSILECTEGIFSMDMDISPAQSEAVVQIAGMADAREFLVLFYPEPLQAWLSTQRDVVQIAANLIGAALQHSHHEEAILESEARNRNIIEALPDLIIRMNAYGRVLDYSARLDHPLYHPPSEVAGKLLSEIWPKEIVQQIMGGNQGEIFNEPHYLKEFQLPFTARTYESRLSPISPHEALLVVRDVTEQAKFLEMKSDFINRASHELRTPLTNAILMAGLIQEGGSPAELQEYWRVLTSELNRQKVLIERLLIAGRLESGAMKLEHSPMDLISILDESIFAMKAIANKRNITIQFSKPEKPVIVVGDKSGLQQVFVNLINNAVKFSPEGSSIRVDITQTEEETQVSIADQGMGISPEDLPHLFERFFRGKNVTIAEIPGSGIGLYIIKSIVEELGGRMMVKSKLQQGTTITVMLERSNSPQASRSGSRES